MASPYRRQSRRLVKCEMGGCPVRARCLSVCAELMRAVVQAGRLRRCRCTCRRQTKSPLCVLSLLAHRILDLPGCKGAVAQLQRPWGVGVAPAATNKASRGLSICNVVDIEKSVCDDSPVSGPSTRCTRWNYAYSYVLDTRVRSEIGSRQSTFFFL